ncbi:hypothetical protein MTR_1g081253 [Medicago truncatula]|uniref:Uncharacterized protein n=1 Tax=Medicago truncatula TaxID=3880 RepID=A0A072VY86_MEDTR|nr:hypothetical protein MTR_1g081253 [Medicago truncatula]
MKMVFIRSNHRSSKLNDHTDVYHLSRHHTQMIEDDGDDSDDSNKEHYPPFVMPKKMTNFKWVLGARFGTKDEFKEAIPIMLSTIGLV